MEYELTEQLITEVFDTDTVYPVSNLKPNAKAPSLFMLAAGNDQMAISIQNFTTKGDSTKQMKPGDKFCQVVLLSLSEKGSLAELKGGLGSDPIGVINTVTDVVLTIAKEHNMDGVLFRFPSKKMKGKEKTINRILTRVVQKRSGGMFTILEEMAHFTAKYSYFVVYRKSKGFTNIKEMGIDSEIFTVSKTPVGEVVKEKKTGKEVTKAEAVAASISKKAESHAPQATATAKRNDIKKTELIKAFSGLSANGKVDIVQTFKASNPKATGDFDSGKDDVYVNAAAISKEFEEYVEPPWDDDDIQIGRDIIKKIKGLGNIKPSPQEITKIIDIVNESNLVNALKRDFIRRFVVEPMNSSIERQYIKMSKTANPMDKYGMKTASALKFYCSAGYKDVNNVFIKNKKPNANVTRIINNLDDAFATQGQTMKKGITLYRGMRVMKNIAEISLENKAFYFRNFVSTSMKPIIFGGGAWGSSTAIHGLAGLQDNEMKSVAMAQSVSFAFVINPGDCACLIPGSISPSEHESEVLLPRGTIFKFNASSVEPASKSVLIACEAYHESQIEEGTVLFDGDALLNEGVIKPFSFSGFLAEAKEDKISSKMLDTLLSLVSFEDVPEKFIE